MEITTPRGATPGGMGLQWGHVFSDVEISFAATRVVPDPALQWGHVFSDVEITTPDPSTDYLAIVLQWGHVFSDVEIIIISGYL